MSGISKFTTSMVSATNENTFALLNLNAGFSLIKVEAPAEYRGLQQALSPQRQQNAEHGPLHRTARKLGALFSQILPPIKLLKETYGRRVSEIAESEKINQKAS